MTHAPLHLAPPILIPSTSSAPSLAAHGARDHHQDQEMLPLSNVNRNNNNNNNISIDGGDTLPGGGQHVVSCYIVEPVVSPRSATSSSQRSAVNVIASMSSPDGSDASRNGGGLSAPRLGLLERRHSNGSGESVSWIADARSVISTDGNDKQQDDMMNNHNSSQSHSGEGRDSTDHHYHQHHDRRHQRLGNNCSPTNRRRLNNSGVDDDDGEKREKRATKKALLAGMATLERPEEMAGREAIPGVLLPFFDFIYFDQRLPQDSFHCRVRKIATASTMASVPLWLTWAALWMAEALHIDPERHPERNTRRSQLLISASLIFATTLFCFIPVCVHFRITKRAPPSHSLLLNCTGNLLFIFLSGMPAFHAAASVLGVIMTTFILTMTPRHTWTVLVSSTLYIAAGVQSMYAACSERAFRANVTREEYGCWTQALAVSEIRYGSDAEMWIFFSAALLLAAALVVAFYAVQLELHGLAVMTRNFAPTLALLLGEVPNKTGGDNEKPTFRSILRMLHELLEQEGYPVSGGGPGEDGPSNNVDGKKVHASNNNYGNINDATTQSTSNEEDMPASVPAPAAARTGEEGSTVVIVADQTLDSGETDSGGEDSLVAHKSFCSSEATPEQLAEKEKWKKLIFFQQKKWSFLSALRAIGRALDVVAPFLPAQSLVNFLTKTSSSSTAQQHQSQSTTLRQSEGICLHMRIVDFVSHLEFEMEQRQRVDEEEATGEKEKQSSQLDASDDGGEKRKRQPLMVLRLHRRLADIIETLSGVVIANGQCGEITAVFESNDGPTSAVACVCALRLVLAAIDYTHIKVRQQRQRELQQLEQPQQEQSNNITDHDERHRQQQEELATAPYHVCIGIHRGQLLLGTVGSDLTRSQPTVAGEAVAGAKLCCAVNGLFSSISANRSSLGNDNSSNDGIFSSASSVSPSSSSALSSIILSDDVFRAAEESLKFTVSDKTPVLFSRRMLGFLECTDADIFCGGVGAASPYGRCPGGSRQQQQQHLGASLQSDPESNSNNYSNSNNLENFSNSSDNNQHHDSSSQEVTKSLEHTLDPDSYPYHSASVSSADASTDNPASTGSAPRRTHKKPFMVSPHLVNADDDDDEDEDEDDEDSSNKHNTEIHHSPDNSVYSQKDVLITARPSVISDAGSAVHRSGSEDLQLECSGTIVAEVMEPSIIFDSAAAAALASAARGGAAGGRRGGAGFLADSRAVASLRLSPKLKKMHGAVPAAAPAAASAAAQQGHSHRSDDDRLFLSPLMREGQRWAFGNISQLVALEPTPAHRLRLEMQSASSNSLGSGALGLHQSLTLGSYTRKSSMLGSGICGPGGLGFAGLGGSTSPEVSFGNGSGAALLGAHNGNNNNVMYFVDPGIAPHHHSSVGRKMSSGSGKMDLGMFSASDMMELEEGCGYAMSTSSSFSLGRQQNPPQQQQQQQHHQQSQLFASSSSVGAGSLETPPGGAKGGLDEERRLAVYKSESSSADNSLDPARIPKPLLPPSAAAATASDERRRARKSQHQQHRKVYFVGDSNIVVGAGHDSGCKSGEETPSSGSGSSGLLAANSSGGAMPLRRQIDAFRDEEGPVFANNNKNNAAQQLPHAAPLSLSAAHVQQEQHHQHQHQQQQQQQQQQQCTSALRNDMNGSQDDDDDDFGNGMSSGSLTQALPLRRPFIPSEDLGAAAQQDTRTGSTDSDVIWRAPDTVTHLDSINSNNSKMENSRLAADNSDVIWRAPDVSTSSVNINTSSAADASRITAESSDVVWKAPDVLSSNSNSLSNKNANNNNVHYCSASPRTDARSIARLVAESSDVIWQAPDVNATTLKNNNNTSTNNNSGSGAPLGVGGMVAAESSDVLWKAPDVSSRGRMNSMPGARMEAARIIADSSDVVWKAPDIPARASSNSLSYSHDIDRDRQSFHVVREHSSPLQLVDTSASGPARGLNTIDGTKIFDGSFNREGYNSCTNLSGANNTATSTGSVKSRLPTVVRGEGSAWSDSPESIASGRKNDASATLGGEGNAEQPPRAHQFCVPEGANAYIQNSSEDSANNSGVQPLQHQRSVESVGQHSDILEFPPLPGLGGSDSCNITRDLADNTAGNTAFSGQQQQQQQQLQQQQQQQQSPRTPQQQQQHPLAPILEWELRSLCARALLDGTSIEMLTSFNKSGALIRAGQLDAAAEMLHDCIAPLDPIAVAAVMSGSAFGAGASRSFRGNILHRRSNASELLAAQGVTREALQDVWLTVVECVKNNNRDELPPSYGDKSGSILYPPPPRLL